MILFLVKGLLRSLYVNKRKTILSLSALSIGIISVLLVLGFGNGVNHEISSQLAEVTGGDKAFKINYLSDKKGGIAKNDSENVRFLEGVSSVKLTNNPHLNTVTLANGATGKTSDTGYDELSRRYSENERDIRLMHGNGWAIDPEDVGVFVKDTLAKQLFNSVEVVNQNVLIGGQSYPIAGIYTAVEGVPELLMSKQAYRKFNDFQVMNNQLIVTYVGGGDTVKERVMAYLKDFGQFRQRGSYQLEDVGQVVTQINETTKMVTNLIAGVAAISLIVAGFGVMSATYSSIAERSEEIGLRRAFGATQRNVRNQFMIEGLLMTTISACFSIGIVLFISFVMGNALGVRLIITGGNVATAIAVPTIVGLVFTYIPAVFASRKNVLDLLK